MIRNQKIVKPIKKTRSFFWFLILANYFQSTKKVDFSSQASSHQRVEIVKPNRLDHELKIADFEKDESGN